jgi:hypothetical protein
MKRKRHQSEKAPIDGNHLGSALAVAVHAAAVEPVSAAPAREDPREGVTKKVQRKPEQEKRRRWERSATSIAPVDNTLAAIASLESGANVARRSGEYGRACASSPPVSRWVPKPIASREVQASWTAPGANEYG